MGAERAGEWREPQGQKERERDGRNRKREEGTRPKEARDSERECQPSQEKGEGEDGDEEGGGEREPRGTSVLLCCRCSMLCQSTPSGAPCSLLRLFPSPMSLVSGHS